MNGKHLDDRRRCRVAASRWKRLLAHPDLVGDAASPRFWFAGDLVNRGPQSLATLRRVIGAGATARVAGAGQSMTCTCWPPPRACGKPSKSGHASTKSCDAPDAGQLIDWLRYRPLAHFEQGHLLVHAGTLAKWDVAKTLSLAAEVQDALRGPNWQKALQKMYGNQPVAWNGRPRTAASACGSSSTR